jgi:hypothetical protein
MNGKRRIMLLAAVAGVAVAGGGVAIAAADSLSPREQSQAVIEDAAEELGVEPTELSAALEKALENRVDEAVTEGRLTEEEGRALKERIGSEDAPLIFGGLGHHGHGPGIGHFGVLEDARAYLGLTETELRAALGEGQSLAEIARDEGKSVDGLIRSLMTSASERLAQAVEDDRLTQTQADSLKESLEERITELVNREPGAGRVFHGPFGGGFGRFQEVPSLTGPRA